MMRLQKYLSAAGVCSRRKGEELIQAGRVSLNGVVVIELGTKADPSVDSIKVDGKTISDRSRRRVFLYFKISEFIICHVK